MEPTKAGHVTTTISKPWWKSTTIWLNVAAFAAFAIGQVLDSREALNLPAAWQAYLGVAVAILNGARRFVIAQPIDNSREAGQVVLTQIDDDGSAKANRVS